MFVLSWRIRQFIVGGTIIAYEEAIYSWWNYYRYTRRQFIDGGATIAY